VKISTLDTLLPNVNGDMATFKIWKKLVGLM
jgi:hypothetical protein